VYKRQAHSVGILGNKLMGVTDLYQIPTIKTIKIGTLGKALGSYGAYILARKEIISFLENRAKPIIYSTALSNFDTMYAYFALKYIHNNLTELKQEIEKRKKLIKRESLILVKESKNDIMLQFEKLKENGVLVGAIRPPTVKKPLFRVTARVSEDIDKLKEVIEWIEQN
jgi:8-amino-7-oxononanoate synthase